MTNVCTNFGAKSFTRVRDTLGGKLTSNNWRVTPNEGDQVVQNIETNLMIPRSSAISAILSEVESKVVTKPFTQSNFFYNNRPSHTAWGTKQDKAGGPLERKIPRLALHKKYGFHGVVFPGKDIRRAIFLRKLPSISCLQEIIFPDLSSSED